MFQSLKGRVGYIGSLTDDRNIKKKRAGKGSCVAIWRRSNYVTEAEIQLNKQNVCRCIEFKDKQLKLLKLFKLLKASGMIAKRHQYFTYKCKKATNVAKMYLLPKTHKMSIGVPGRPLITNCGRSIGKISEILKQHLKPNNTGLFEGSFF